MDGIMSNKVIIVTDSTVDLSKEIVEKFDIKVLPLHVVFDEKSYRDGIDISNSELFEKINATGIMPKTQGAAPGDFINFFEPYIEQGYDIFYVGIGQDLSCTYRSAYLAAETFDEGRIYLSDSKNLSTGIGLLVLKAAKLRNQGKSAKEIKEEIDKIVPNVKSQFVVESLDFLHRGGRCSGAAKFFGTMLRLRPLIVVRNGKLGVGKKIIGSVKKALGVMIDLFLADLDNIDPDCVFITGVLSESSNEYIKSKIMTDEVKKHIDNYYVTEAGSVISSHCGPGTVGILYIVKDANSNADELILSNE